MSKSNQVPFDYKDVDITDIPVYKSELATYYNYSRWESFRRAHMATVEEEFKRLKLKYNTHLHAFTPKQLKVIVGILGRF